MAFGPEGLVEQDGASLDLAALDALLDGHPVVWLDVAGLGDGALLAELAERFGIHRLAMEDVVNVHQRPKVEAYGEHFLVLLREPWLDAGEADGGGDQVSLFVGPGWLLSFQEDRKDCFEPVRERIRQPGRLIQRSGSDYLAYALIDTLVDAHFPILEAEGDALEALQDQILRQPDPELLAEIYEAKHRLSSMRREIWPLRELLNGMIRDPLPGLRDETRIYLRDCYDHAIVVLELCEGLRDMASELMNFYLSAVGNRANEIMKVLTIIGAIFIPLTFVAGIYGMNFDPDRGPWNMPELRWAYGYPATLALMLVIALVMLWFFKRRGWLG
jgi:magnesium transporter